MRFGFELIEYMAGFYHCKIEMIEPTEQTEQQELVEDLVQILMVFSCRLQGTRAKQVKKMIQELMEDGKSSQSDVNSK